MNTQIQNTIVDALNWRAAVKAYDSTKAISDSELNTIIEAARMSPSAYGLQPYRLIEVKNTELRAKLREAGYGQAQITDANHLYVLAARTDIDENFIKELIALTSLERNVPVENLKGFEDMMLGDINTRDENGKSKWAHRQSYIALGFILETAALLGVDASPMEGFNNAAADDILGLASKNLTSVCLIALGHRSSEDSWSTMPKVRVTKDEFVVMM